MIWRRLLMASDTTLAELHDVLQVLGCRFALAVAHLGQNTPRSPGANRVAPMEATAPSTVTGPDATLVDAPTSPELRVVIVDTRHERRQVMRHLTEHCGTDLVVVGSVEDADQALASIAAHRAGVAIVEIQLPLADGLELVSALRAAHPDLGIVVCSFHATAATQRDARARGADVYLTKPVSARELARGLASAVSVPWTANPRLR